MFEKRSQREPFRENFYISIMLFVDFDRTSFASILCKLPSASDATVAVTQVVNSH